MSHPKSKPGAVLAALGFEHGWTGGQYSLFRALLGVYLCVQFAMLVPWGPELFSSAGALADASHSPLAYAFPNILAWFDPPWFVTGLLVAASMGSLMVAAGVRDRLAAVLVWYVWACLFGRNPLISNPSLAFVGWMLLLHAALPGKPYGAWSARGRPDPSGGWALPSSYFAAAWTLMAAGYSYSGYTKLISPSWLDGSALAAVLQSPLARPTWLRDALLGLPELVMQLATWGALALELLALPVALIARARAPLWLALVGLHLGIIVTVSFTELTLGMLLVHLLTFNPKWVAPLRRGASDYLFFDGSCGLCHRSVRFVLAEEVAGSEETPFRFAPLGGETFDEFFVHNPDTPSPDELPDSLIVVTERDEVLMRSDAVLYLARRLGGVWRVLATLAALVPGVVRDRVYDGIASIRHRLFAKPKEVCPLMPPEVRRRFKP